MPKSFRKDEDPDEDPDEDSEEKSLAKLRASAKALGFVIRKDDDPDEDPDEDSDEDSEEKSLGQEGAIETVYNRIYQLEEAVKELAYALSTVADTQRGFNEAMTKGMDSLPDLVAEIVQKAIGVKAAAEAAREGHAMVSGLKTPAGMNPTPSGAPDTKEVMPMQIPARETKENDESIYTKNRQEVIKRVSTPSPDVGALTSNPSAPRNPLQSTVMTLLNPETKPGERVRAIKAITFGGSRS